MSRSYPRKAEITRAVEAAKACGVPIDSIEVSPNGTIKISRGARTTNRQDSEFDRLDAEGRL